VRAKEEKMSKTCSICGGAIPNGEKSVGHTALCAQVVSDSKTDAIDDAWGIIANAFGGNWDQASPEWRQAAERWRDKHIACRSASATPKSEG
jgi:hypothetical protein